MSGETAAPSARAGEALTVAVLGAGRLGAALIARLAEASTSMCLGLVADVAADSEGMRLALQTGVPTSSEGTAAVLGRPDVRLVFDASGARAHALHAQAILEAGKLVVDLTPGAAGPAAVPAVSRPDGAGGQACLVSSTAQAAVPIAAALSRLAPLAYFEVVTTVAASTLGPGTRMNVDELTVRSSRALENPGGALRGKAVLIVSPADPPPLMRCTVYAVLGQAVEESAVRDSIRRMVTAVQGYAPGYRLRRDPRIESRETPAGKKPVLEAMLEVEGPRSSAFSGNLELMAAAAERVGGELAKVPAGAAEVVA